MHKRKNVSVLNGTTKRLEPSKGIKIPISPGHDDDAAAAAAAPAAALSNSLSKQRGAAAARAAKQAKLTSARVQLRNEWINKNGPLPDLSQEQQQHPDWWQAEENRADRMIATIIRSHTTRSDREAAPESGPSEEKRAAIRWNFHYMGFAARKQRYCSGTEEGRMHEDAWHCSTVPFRPSELFGAAGPAVEFAHWQQHQRMGDQNLLVGRQAAAVADFGFVTFLANKGRFLRHQCHAIETHGLSTP